jgi:hypothetical protein
MPLNNREILEEITSSSASLEPALPIKDYKRLVFQLSETTKGTYNDYFRAIQELV